MNHLGDPFEAAAPLCWFCGVRMGALLCDGTLAWLKGMDGTRVVIDRSAKAFTCDRPMCRPCVAESTMIHINMKPKSTWESLDYCRDCVREELHLGGNPNIFGTLIINGMQRRAYLVTMDEGLALQARRLFKTESRGKT